jgi:hypothetical protein
MTKKTKTKSKNHVKKSKKKTTHPSTTRANSKSTLPLRRVLRKADTTPRLRFTPAAWAKLVYLCHRGDTEIGGFGVASTDDLLLVDELFLPLQTTTAVTVAFDDESVADFFEDQVVAGRSPEHFGRVWIHTHPGNCPSPSTVDEETFTRVFGGCDWAVMFILARGGATYARLRFNAGPGGAMEIPVEVDYRSSFAGSDHPAWEAEYQANVHPQEAYPLTMGGWDADEITNPFELADELDLYDEVELDLH